MDKFASIDLELRKNVKKGEKGTLLSLFNADERFKRMKTIIDAEEGANMKVELEGLGEVDLKLGDDVDKGQRKTIMTLFWFSEKSKPFEIEDDVEAGKKISINIWRI